MKKIFAALVIFCVFILIFLLGSATAWVFGRQAAKMLGWY